MIPTFRSPRRRPALLLVALLALVIVGCGSDSDEGGSADTAVFGQAPATGSVERGDGSQPLPPFDRGSADLARGRQSPEVSGTTVTGESVTIGAPGKAQVVVFLAHWCPHCQAEVPRIVKHLDENPLPSDVDLYGVATSTVENRPNFPPSDWLERESWQFPTLDDVDNSVQVQFGLTGFPFFAAIDAEGVVVVRGSGELSTAQFDLLVEAARTGSAPA